MARTDMVIELDNDEPGALARIAGALSDAGVNIAAATALGALAVILLAFRVLFNARHQLRFDLLHTPR